MNDSPAGNSELTLRCTHGCRGSCLIVKNTLNDFIDL